MNVLAELAAGEAPVIDLGNLTGVGVGAILLALVFRTLWRQEGGWRSVLTASREDAALARKEAELARSDAAVAREDARVARSAESECRRRLSRLDIAVADLREKHAESSKRLDVIDEATLPSGEIPETPSAGE